MAMTLQDAPLKAPNDDRLAQPDMSEAEVRQWIDACNHEPARRFLRRSLAIVQELERSFKESATLRTQISELKRTRSESEANARVEGYREGAAGVVSQLRALSITVNTDPPLTTP